MSTKETAKVENGRLVVDERVFSGSISEIDEKISEISKEIASCHKMIHEPTNKEILGAFQDHAKEDHAFQTNQSEFNTEMAVFKAETEGSLAALHEKVDKILIQQSEMKAKLDPMDEAFKGLLFSQKVMAGIGPILGVMAMVGSFVFWLAKIYFSK